jgi:alpha-glucoside transport system substrate-binding protein
MRSMCSDSAGQEWMSITAWFGSGQSVEQVAKDSDAAWP